jgi:hypothetical protein
VDMFPGVGGRPKFSRPQLQELLEESESFDKVFETLLEFVDLNDNMQIEEEEIDLVNDPVESKFSTDNIFSSQNQNISQENNLQPDMEPKANSIPDSELTDEIILVLYTEFRAERMQPFDHDAVNTQLNQEILY